jgi:aspartyl-tRNA(Asn)/glutamyl-tRNA(Gln) amidotransferase subunit A
VGAETVTVGDATERVGAALTRLTSPWNLAGVCAGAVPVAVDSGSAPVALQVVGPWRSEATVLGVMSLLERLAGGPWPPVAAPGG